MLVCGTLPVTCIVPCGPWGLYMARIPLGHETMFSSRHQMNEHSMVDITHDEAVGILKATHDSVVLQVEKNAIADTGTPTSPSGANADIKPHDKCTVELRHPDSKGLGFNIIGGEGDAGIFISYISPGSFSDQSEKLTAGDQIVEVKDHNIKEMTRKEWLRAWRER